ncbi:hypothetical protein [Pseudomonas nicosulfuronedens]
MSNLWKNCWEVPAGPMARGFAEAGYFLIRRGFSMTCEPVYRLRRNSCARSVHRYPRFVLTHLCATCGKHHQRQVQPGFQSVAQRLISEGGKRLIHDDFSPGTGLRETFHNACGANLAEGVDNLYPDRCRPRAARPFLLSTFFVQSVKVAPLLAFSEFSGGFSTLAVQRSAGNLWVGCG